MILALKTDSSDTELYLLNANGTIEQQKLWPAGRTLARDLPGEIDQLIDGKYNDLTGIIAFQGPGSFTGLRIGITTANALAYANQIPIVGTGSEDWLTAGLARLASGNDDKIVLPEYGAPATITMPKK
ncbi:MAG: tRNA (adenosine(37)-N6)-threonylcarbamoyltransferase complex dimerization subunit type 1 TsaB [Sphaerimonospora mesophila]